jgi:hypothetical protein
VTDNAVGDGHGNWTGGVDDGHGLWQAWPVQPRSHAHWPEMVRLASARDFPLEIRGIVRKVEVIEGTANDQGGVHAFKRRKL